MEELVEAGVAYHRSIAYASGNTMLAWLIESLSGPVQHVRVWLGMTQTGTSVPTLDEHRAIFAVTSAWDLELARTWATVHIGGCEDWRRSTLGDKPATAKIRPWWVGLLQRADLAIDFLADIRRL